MIETPLHRHTPLIDSRPLSERFGVKVRLKLETEQPVRSFKIRGIGRLAQHRVRGGAKTLVSSSGGNAGLAAAYAGRQLGVPVTVVVPSTTPEFMREQLRAESAEVLEHGDAWDEAHAHALRLAEQRSGAVLHPFDDPEIWAGHSTVITEDEDARRPDAVLVAVGGGGLLCGVAEGLAARGWDDVPIVAVETEGAASLARSVAAGERVTLPSIESIATTLGARTVGRQTFEWTAKREVSCVTVTDEAALEACQAFHDDHRVWVEPSCGAALAALSARRVAFPDARDLLVIVCGGAGVHPELIAQWETRLGIEDPFGP
ncbi:MAG: pyridoxal-phosphate dependent enzyme [Planctomycetota bacterium]